MSKQKRKTLHAEKKSHRLFFRKYPYKIHFKSHYELLRCNPAAVSFRWLEEVLINMKPSQDRKKVRNPMLRFGVCSNWGNATSTRSEIQQAIEVLKIIQREKKDGARIRQENSLSLFINDESVIDEILKAAPDFNIEYHKPESDGDLRELMKDVNIVFTPREYDMPYKVYFSSKSDLTGLSNWIRNNPDKVKLTGGSRRVVEDPKRYHYDRSGRYFYVKDESTVTLLLMAQDNAIRRVDKMVYKPK